jgi:hypothetical protein
LISNTKLDLDTFKELCVKVLIISMPNHSVRYSFQCKDSQVKNFDKITKQDELRAIERRLEEKDDPKLRKVREELIEAIELLPDMVECQNIIEQDITYEAFDNEREHLLPKVIKIGEVRAVRVSVKAKMLVEEITRHEVLQDRIVFMESLKEEKLKELSSYVLKEGLDFKKILEDDVYILFDVLFLAVHNSRSLRGMKSLIKEYDRLIGLDYPTMKAYDLELVESLNPLQSNKVEITCKACKKIYQADLSIEDFSFVPD